MNFPSILVGIFMGMFLAFLLIQVTETEWVLTNSTIEEYFHTREVNCSRCVWEHFGVNLTPGDWRNVSPFMAEVCGDCKPMVMV